MTDPQNPHLSPAVTFFNPAAPTPEVSPVSDTAHPAVSEPPADDPVGRLRRLQGEKRAARNARELEVQAAHFETDRDKDVRKGLEELADTLLRNLAAVESDDHDAHGRLAEGRTFVLIGGSGAGKSRTLQHQFVTNPEFLTDDGKPSPLLLSVTAPAPCTMRILAKTINTATGYQTHRDPKESEAWDLVRHNLELRGIRFLHIDEFQHALLSRNPVEIQKIRDSLKSLLQNPRWPVNLILSGLPEIAAFIEEDVQIRRRCTFVRFDPLRFPEDVPMVKSMIAFYGKTKGGLDLGDVRRTELVSRLMHASLGELGLTIEFIQDAIGQALRAESPTLETVHFAKAYDRRTGCPEGLNVFTAQGDWTAIDARRALFPDEAADEDGAEKKKSKKSGNPRTK